MMLDMLKSNSILGHADKKDIDLNQLRKLDTNRSLWNAAAR